MPAQKKKTPNPLRERKPRKGNFVLAVLSAIATETVRIAATTEAFATLTPSQAHSVTRLNRRWHYEFFERSNSITVDFEAMLRQAKSRVKFAKAVHDIRKRRFVRIVHRGGKRYLKVTDAGRRYLVRAELDTLKIDPQPKWDGQWRIVLFDVPERERRGRDAFRRKLRELGFLQFQKSAFVVPHPCDDALDVIVRAFHIADHATFFETDSLGYHEAKALAHFSLRRPKRS